MIEDKLQALLLALLRSHDDLEDIATVIGLHLRELAHPAASWWQQDWEPVLHMMLRTGRLWDVGFCVLSRPHPGSADIGSRVRAAADYLRRTGKLNPLWIR